MLVKKYLKTSNISIQTDGYVDSKSLNYPIYFDKKVPTV